MLTNSPPLAALELASPWMLGWLAAAALPWLINLWSRRRHVDTSWAAVELLLEAVHERSRRLRLRELLLLALRTSILVLVALAAARPIWRQAAGAATAERTHHVIAVDRSYSMATEHDGLARFARAQAAARTIVSEAPVGDAFSVIAWGDAGENVLGRPTFDVGAALAAIDSLEPADTVARLDSARRAISAAIAEASQSFPGLARTQVTFVTDLGLNTWSAALKRDDDARAGDAILPAGARVESVDDGVQDNVAITELRTEPALPVVDEPLTAVVDLKSYGAQSISRATVELLLDGNRLGQQQANFSGDGEATVRFDVRLAGPDGHVLEARLQEGVDSLAVDNRRWLSTEATPRVRALCVTDVAGGGEDIARALNPRYREAAAGRSIAVDVVPTAALARTDLTVYEAVFLCNVADLLPREERLLRRYVTEGGALAIVLGDRTKPAALNVWLHAEPELSPAAVADQPAVADVRFDPLEYRHPIMQPFAGRSRSGLLGVRVSKYYPLQLANDDSAAVPLEFTSGDPAVVINKHGGGRVAILATNPALSTAGEPWSTLALSPAFVPLVRELFTHLTADRRTSQLNYLAGESVETLSPSQSRQQGVYEIGGRSIAVNVDTSESDLTAVSPADLHDSAAGVDVESVAAGLSYGESIPLAGYLLLAAAALMFVELTIAGLLGRGWA